MRNNVVRILAVLSSLLPLLANAKVSFEFEVPFNGKIKYSGDQSLLPIQYEFEPRVGIKMGQFFQTGLIYLSQSGQTDGWNIIDRRNGADTAGLHLESSLYKKNTYKSGYGVYLQINLPNQLVLKSIYPFLGAEIFGQITTSDILFFNQTLDKFEKSEAPQSNAVLHEFRQTNFFGFKGDFHEHFGLFGVITLDLSWYNLLGIYKSSSSGVGAKWGMLISI